MRSTPVRRARRARCGAASPVDVERACRRSFVFPDAAARADASSSSPAAPASRRCARCSARARRRRPGRDARPSYPARTPAEFAYLPELRALARQRRSQLALTLTGDADRLAHGRGRAGADHLARAGRRRRRRSLRLRPARDAWRSAAALHDAGRADGENVRTKTLVDGTCRTLRPRRNGNRDGQPSARSDADFTYGPADCRPAVIRGELASLHDVQPLRPTVDRASVRLRPPIGRATRRHGRGDRRRTIASHVTTRRAAAPSSPSRDRQHRHRRVTAGRVVTLQVKSSARARAEAERLHGAVTRVSESESALKVGGVIRTPRIRVPAGAHIPVA